MSNIERYNDSFVGVFNIAPEALGDSFVFGSHNWDSLAHMELIAVLEDTFDIMLEPDDMTHFGSYENGKLILSKYGVEF